MLKINILFIIIKREYYITIVYGYYLVFLFLKVIFVPDVCERVVLPLSNISFVSLFVLIPTKSLTSGLLSDFPTLSCISCCFCCALVLVGALMTLP